MIAFADLAAMDRRALAALWSDLLRVPLPPNISQPMLRRFLAYELQVRRTGDLPAAVARRIEEAGRVKRRPQAPALKPGGRLLREWNGTTHVVEVVAGGFDWNGTRHASLSAIARAITGARWSGPRFFGLTGGQGGTGRRPKQGQVRRGRVVTAPVRCAIYTRKSSDEGMEQAFNSLDAQHEACSAYIASQRHEGWKLVPERFDDGGVSGGTLERPALRRLLAEIDAGRIGMVVVYKIDRLTRSLADFVRLVERLDAKGCSFVSVTQAFNTSTSMGRLTLNVLLSFAQFEREVTAERIRDKIAASKKKGLWMGGTPPLGYDRHPDPQRRELVVNPPEADTVRHLFRVYAEGGNLHALAQQARDLGLRPKQPDPASKRDRAESFSRGQLRYLLTNPTYLGRIRHKDRVWPGLHPAIVDEALWDRVQEQIAIARARPSARPGMPNHRPLRGRLFDETGQRLTPVHSLSRGRRFLYYSSRRVKGGTSNGTGWRLPAAPAERAIRDIVAAQLLAAAESHRLLAVPDAARLATVAARARDTAARLEATGDGLATLVRRVDLRLGSVTIHLDPETVAAAFDVPPEDLAPGLLRFDAAFALRRRGAGTRIVTGATIPEPDQNLLRVLGQARGWARGHRGGSPPAQLSQASGRSVPYVRERIGLAFLSPKLQAAILKGRQPPDLTLERLLRQDIPLDWDEQHARFGLL